MRTVTLKAGTTENLLDDQIEPFLKHLRAAGYAQSTLRFLTLATTALNPLATRQAGSNAT
jgi:hypothetical protein